MNFLSILARSMFLAVNLSTIIYAQDLKYLVYDRDQISGSAYHSRRERLMEEIGNDAVAVFFSAPERVRNADTDYLYRQDDNFYYLTGCNEPNSILLLSAKGMAVRNLQDSTRTDTVREILFVQPRDVRREQWSGRRFGPEGAMKFLGFEHALAVEQFKSTLSDIVSSSGTKFLYAPIIAQETPGRVVESSLRSCIDTLKTSGFNVELRDPTPIVRKFRIVKSTEEIDLITRAAHISAIAHRQAMMSCRPGMSEFELQAVYEYVFRRMGSEYPAYPSIVGAAENSVILHYDTNRRTINDGDIVLADCGAEYHNYASDVTRTYPSNGKFSKAQRQVYQVVLDAQNATIAMMKPGVLWMAVSAKADSVLENGLCELGIVREKNKREFRKFFPHGLGHAVGLDVHDVNAPVMMAGMIYTIEPGIYIPENAQGVDPKYFNIGVRIEDDILITPDGHTVLSGEAPREIDDIEALMKRNGIGDVPID